MIAQWAAGEETPKPISPDTAKNSHNEEVSDAPIP